jgi:phosphoribosylaminoimidazolecarboxamide formyltransferase/IMP cyclohydrolase
MELPGLGRLEEWRDRAFLDIKTLADGGLVLQKSFVDHIIADADFLPAAATTHDGLSVIARRPGKKELDDLRFAWAVEAGVSSNSVIFARDGATLAIGTGEQDRVGCVELATHKAYTKYADFLSFSECGISLYELKHKAAVESEFKEKLDDVEARTKAARAGLPGSVLVSDGFFPFRDGVDAAIRQGVTAIAQPGGSLRDEEAVMACNEANPQVAMVFTGQRSFKH